MLQNIFFNLTILSLSLSLSPPIFGNSITTILFFPPPIFDNSITTNQFFSFFFLFQFRQLGFHNSFFFFLQFSAPISATWLPQFFSFSPISATWLPQFLFSLSSFLPYNFSNLVATIAFFLSSTSLLRALHLGSQIWVVGISVTSLLKFKFFLTSAIKSFLSPLSYFLLEFWQRCCQNLLIFSFFQITSNSSHITNKFIFWKYSVKRLVYYHIWYTLHTQKKKKKPYKKQTNNLFILCQCNGCECIDIF